MHGFGSKAFAKKSLTLVHDRSTRLLLIYQKTVKWINSAEKKQALDLMPNL